jgi:hypothetical protein
MENMAYLLDNCVEGIPHVLIVAAFKASFNGRACETFCPYDAFLVASSPADANPLSLHSVQRAIDCNFWQMHTGEGIKPLRVCP